MGKSASKQPAAPDPTVVATAQATANQQTAAQNQQLNMVGSQDQTGSVSWVADPSQPGGYRQVSTLSAPEQQSYDLTKQAETGALSTANDQLKRVQDALAKGFDLSALPGLNTGDQARQQAQDAAYAQSTARLDPQFAREQSQLETKLANQGLSANSEAFGNRQQQFAQGKNDAYSQARQDSVQQGNAAQDQAFGQSLTARENAMNENAYAQNLPLNQFSGLLGLGQVGTPQSIGYTPAQQANTDVLGSYALNSQVNNQNAQRAADAKSAMMGGLFKLGGAAILASDRRLKRDMTRLGERPDGLGVWLYRYKNSSQWIIGAMADEVRKLYPHAVFKGRNGFLAVSYASI